MNVHVLDANVMIAVITSTIMKHVIISLFVHRFVCKIGLYVKGIPGLFRTGGKKSDGHDLL